MTGLLIIVLLGGSIAFLLWPNWPSPAIPSDAPAIPITVGGVGFNVPPAAIRMPVQRRPGAHDRVDLAYLWPSLEPPDATAKPAAPSPAPQIEGVPLSTHPQERIFITIASAGDTLAPIERVRTIYPRYLEKEAAAGPDGLAVLPFREGSPYQGEDLICDPGQPENFLVRCTRNGAGPTPGMCLYERRIEGADLIVRFPRDWLDGWRAVAAGVERLIASSHPAGLTSIRGRERMNSSS